MYHLSKTSIKGKFNGLNLNIQVWGGGGYPHCLIAIWIQNCLVQLLCSKFLINTNRSNFIKEWVGNYPTPGKFASAYFLLVPNYIKLPEKNRYTMSLKIKQKNNNSKKFSKKNLVNEISKSKGSHLSSIFITRSW